MKRLLAILIMFCVLTLANLNAQNHIGINLRVDASKTWKLNKKTRVEIGQQFQVNPEFNKNQKKFGETFNELNLFPVGDSDDDGIDDDEDDDTADDDEEEEEEPGNGGISQPLGSLNDKPYNILFEWRSATNAAINYRITEWLRVGQSYAFNIRAGGDIRHSLQTNLTFIEKVNDVFEFSQRIGFQYTSREKKGETIWEEDLVGRTGFAWDFNKKHTFETSIGVNGAFDKGVWEWDRLRVDAGLRYRLTKVQSFDFSYRFQQTLDKKSKVSHGVNFGYLLDF